MKGKQEEEERVVEEEDGGKEDNLMNAISVPTHIETKDTLEKMVSFLD
ncbi:hypothetical protein L195_g044712 [Trifolium pratense]|uniref:Uncharacterized protein n=1 Tax=Trifolium pratense TaxID=57577 RepID=A0A2K3LQJ3_TRIPR|nr:hypothetical protein L195_g036815 [Trifolium pratense]PNX88606.1 hypothetical protein L195_g044712 [Trifolium pratense]